MQKIELDHQEVLRKFQELGTATRAAEHFGVSTPTVVRHLNELGLTFSKGSNPPNKLPMEDVIRRYTEGESTCQIAKSLGVDDEVIRRRLNRRGVKMRPPGGWETGGEKNSQWKGKGGYKEGKYQARKTYFALVGRRVLPGKVLHHMDENTDNNDPDNLWEFPNGSCHSRYHQRLLHLQRQGLPADANQIALKNGGLPLRRLIDPNAELPSIVPPNPCDKQEKTQPPRTS